MRFAQLLLAGLAALVSTSEAPSAVVLPPRLPGHPRLTISREQLPAIRERAASDPESKAAFQTLRQDADQWLGRELVLPPRGSQWYHYYSCSKHGARLRTEGPTRHVCPVDGEIFTGYPYDDVVLSTEHNRLAAALRTLGWVYQVSGDPRYAARARDILLAYAARYQSYPLHDIRGAPRVGGGKVGPQTLDESTWLITMLEGADLIWMTLSDLEREKAARELIYPATAVIRDHKLGIHNIQCWKNAAVGLAGLLLGDLSLVEEAINGPSGFVAQVEKGVSVDGAWYEGAWGYHFYTLSALIHLAEAAFHCGINLYDARLQRMFDGPLQMAMPNLVLPAFNDSHEVDLTRQTWLYEIASSRFQHGDYARILARSQRTTEGTLLRGVKTPRSVQAPSASGRDFRGSGFAILARGSGPNATWFGLDYGPHGGGHGHPDKLAFVLFARGHVLAPDPGTANYGVPIQAGWYRTTLAHNTLTVDEQSQRSTEGRCLEFVEAGNWSAVMCEAGPIYDGVTFVRTAALIGEDLLVVLDQVKSVKERVMDLAYHQRGRWLGLTKDTQPCSMGARPGYSYLRDTRCLDSKDGLTLQCETEGVGPVVWTMAAGPDTSFVIGTGVGAHTEDRVPIVLARRRTRETAFIWAIGLPPDSRSSSSSARAAVSLAPEPMKTPGSPSSEAVAVRIRWRGGTCLLGVNPAGGAWQLMGCTGVGRLAFLRQQADGRWLAEDLGARP